MKNHLTNGIANHYIKGMVKDVEKYARYWRKRFEEEKQASEKRRLERLTWLPRVVEILKKYDARKIILFGSLVREDRQIYERSDMDLAVAGIPAEKFFSALGDLMMTLPFPVDLKPLEEVDPLFKEMIFKYGKVIYEEPERSPSFNQ